MVLLMQSEEEGKAQAFGQLKDCRGKQVLLKNPFLFSGFAMCFVIFPNRFTSLLNFHRHPLRNTVHNGEGQMARVLPPFLCRKSWIQEKAGWVGIVVVQISPW